jgi:hypothetical protein
VLYIILAWIAVIKTIVLIFACIGERSSPILLISKLMDFKDSTHTVGQINGITNVSVSDFGKGIASENPTHLFVRCFRKTFWFTIPDQLNNKS